MPSLPEPDTLKRRFVKTYEPRSWPSARAMVEAYEDVLEAMGKHPERGSSYIA